MADQFNILDIGSQIPTFRLLDDIVAILGATKTSFAPFLENRLGSAFDVPYFYGEGGRLSDFRAKNASGDIVITTLLPFKHIGGIHSWLLNKNGDHHLNWTDDTDFEFGNGTVDAPFSLGMWTQMVEEVGTQRTLLAKYRTSATAAREYDFRFDASGNLELELYDESADATEIATGGTPITPGIFQLVVATYDGNEATPAIHLYLNGIDTNSSGASTESGTYVAMETSGVELLVGARNITGSPAQEFFGRVALPFITGKELTAANVASLYDIGQELLGLA